MPSIIDYPTVLESLEAKGFRCLYHNSGAFGFAAESQVCHVGWIGKPDSSIRDSANLRQFKEPFLQDMIDLVVDAWIDRIPGPIWLMPKSHWSYELQFGNADWLHDMLEGLAIDPKRLEGLNNAAAVVFEQREIKLLKGALCLLLSNLRGSDFMLVFPDYGTVCTVHHHQQLWWQSTRSEVIECLR